MTKNKTQPKHHNFILRVSALTALVFASVFILHLFLHRRGIDQTYFLIIFVLTTLSYLLILAGTWLVLKRQANAKPIKYAIVLIVVVGLLVFGLLGFAAIKDLVGVHCTDMWGWSTQKCYSEMSGWIYYLLFLPSFFIPLALVTSTLLAVGALIEAQKQSVFKLRK